MNKAFDVRHPIFRPLWRRAVITIFILCWGIFELLNGSTVWAALFGACGVYLFLQFFVQFDPADYEARDRDPE